MAGKNQIAQDDAAPAPEPAPSLEAVARRYSTALTHFFQRRVANKADVPDMVQDVFLRLSKLSDISAIRHPEHYVFQTASSALRDQARREISRLRRAHEEFDDAVHGASDFSPERVLAGKQDVERLRAAVAGLPARTRDVFVFRVFEEMKTIDIAAVLGISQRAVEKHYAKGMAAVTAAMRSNRHV
ncbi:sigma-70 family RNA polymerase sigma factor [Phenylobacterium sp. LjRoot219]|uniref:RNA polymerase sigma factor n=1 Tax=Phenylobacterium sp. LjRoot219 TaxID=3342283 RepID=UPI003ECD96C9